jgi:hypothetical protein
MAESGTNPSAGTDGDLHPVLDRIAAALERRNQQAEKKPENDGGGGQKEGGGKDKKAEGSPEKKDEPPGKAKRFVTSPLGILILIVLVVLLVLIGLRIWHYESTHVSTDDAYTTGHVHQISPRVNGLVLELWVDDNQHVEQGDLLIKLDPKDAEVVCARAQADLAQSQAQVLQVQGQLLQAEAGIGQAKAQVAQALAQVDQAGANYEVAGVNYGRNSTLYGKDLRAVAKADVDATKSTLDANKAALDASKANSDAAQANCDKRKPGRRSGSSQSRRRRCQGQPGQRQTPAFVLLGARPLRRADQPPDRRDGDAAFHGPGHHGGHPGRRLGAGKL